MASTPIVISDYTLKKTRQRHPEISVQDYRAIPIIVADGVFIVGNKPNAVQLIGSVASDSGEQTYSLVIKAAGTGELFVSTLHRLKFKEAKRLYNRALDRGTLLRDHKTEMARHLWRRAMNS